MSAFNNKTYPVAGSHIHCTTRPRVSCPRVLILPALPELEKMISARQGRGGFQMRRLDHQLAPLLVGIREYAREEVLWRHVEMLLGPDSMLEDYGNSLERTGAQRGNDILRRMLYEPRFLLATSPKTEPPCPNSSSRSPSFASRSSDAGCARKK
jgi:hypothetical protein